MTYDLVFVFSNGFSVGAKKVRKHDEQNPDTDPGRLS
jgi:hypothetical protein